MIRTFAKRNRLKNIQNKKLTPKAPATTGAFYFLNHLLITSKCHPMPGTYIVPAFLLLMIPVLINSTSNIQAK